MSKVYTDPQNYTNIAAAIRQQLGNSDNYKPSEMPAAILSIAGNPVIQPKTITENGTYTAPSGVDGYSPITVNVSGGGGTDGNYLISGEEVNIEKNLSNWTWYAAAGCNFPNTYSNGTNTVNGYVGGGGHERLKKSVSGLSLYSLYMLTFKFCSPTGFSDGNYADPCSCIINSTSASYPSGTNPYSNYYSYITGMTRLNSEANSTPKEYAMFISTKNSTQINLSFEFGSILDGVSADFIFSDIKLTKVTSIRQAVPV